MNHIKIMQFPYISLKLILSYKSDNGDDDESSHKKLVRRMTKAAKEKEMKC